MECVGDAWDGWVPAGDAAVMGMSTGVQVPRAEALGALGVSAGAGEGKEKGKGKEIAVDDGTEVSEVAEVGQGERSSAVGKRRSSVDREPDATKKRKL